MISQVSQLHAEICRTLGSAARIEILRALKDGEKTVNELSKTLGLRQANVSQHLAILRQRRVVATRKEGTNIYYKVSNPKIIQACELMRQVLVEQLRETEQLSKIVER
ncbi:MAG: metalloregulator ArsR/SmtB family transcription factor [Thaumarchaeota archaeon]|nr:metalloregulator ArsR/SmtB family transcription factor [Nitrososphaerota archaeon]MCL5317124.1 metalloregulator ArsR/SmtB family transcription factor [Nitrososphaerota archaeon]